MSGNDMVYFYANPAGTGLRVTGQREAEAAVLHLLEHPDAANKMGRMGREFVLQEYHENHQRRDLAKLLEFLSLDETSRRLSQQVAPSRMEIWCRAIAETGARRYRRLVSKVLTRDWQA